MPDDKITKIHAILKSLPDSRLEGLKKLFWEELNYNHQNTTIAMGGWTPEFKELFMEPPVLFASAASDDSFHILYFPLITEKMSVGIERQVINRLVTDYPHSLFVFSNHSQKHWHFINAIYEKDAKAQKHRVLRRISVSPEDRLRTASERIAKLDVELAAKDLFGISSNTVQVLHEQAFDVEAVTEEFFNDYKNIYTLLREDLFKQSKDQAWAHDFALHFMNRLMFLYYIERKRWLGGDPDFLHNYWRTYRRNKTESDSFVTKWLNILFFEAFNNQFSANRSDLAYLPENYRNALQMAPFLNGGLFTKNGLDHKCAYLITDSLIAEIFDFLDRYNFTISEDTPLDQEVAVDPEMIGKVYESLVNVSAEADEQGGAGIFYTPRIEIDLMCRLSLVDWLANQFPNISKSTLYEFIFAFSLEDKKDADLQLTKLNLWPALDQCLNSLTVLDPACGSGSFLVGMLVILDDLLARCAAQLGRQETPYERRKRIIGSSLYGVDIMEWAVHVAELRLWLQLVIDTEINPEKLKFRPLLPNLSFKIRRGDSLVQEIGGMNFGLKRMKGHIRGEISGKITRLKGEKLKFYNNEPNRQFTTKEQVEQAEYHLFCEIVADEIHSKELIQRELEQALEPAQNLFGEVQDQQLKLDRVGKQQDLAQVQDTLIKLREAHKVLGSQKNIPFVWDVVFVEIFEGDKKGFDIVIGNPPYVRQEKIHDPGLTAERGNPENNRQYKDKLARAVYSAWPLTFSYNPARNSTAWTLNRKSDYYIYFYFTGLSLLNEKGSFCFITSNSWLDVGYGSDLQRFLLTRGKVKLIIDNQVRRSFKSADVNTIIVLFGSPADSKADRKDALENTARFVMFKVPFEQGLSPVIWEEVEDVSEKKLTNEYHAMAKPQRELLNNGLDPESGMYAGDKWGGKYLRAPDIYWVIMEKCKDKLVRLGDIADVRRGITTGANEFFYLDEEKIRQWGIEEEFLVPVIKSPKEFVTYEISPTTLRYKLLLINSEVNVRGKNVYEYIKWGEKNNFHKNASVQGRKNWWLLSANKGDTYWGKELRNRIAVFTTTQDTYADCRLYVAKTSEILKSILNSTFCILISEVEARDIGGGGGPRSVMVYEVQSQLVPSPDSFEKNKSHIINSYKSMKKRSIENIETELSMFDRNELDKAICDVLGLSNSHLDLIYEEVIKIIKNRLSKAGSI